MASSPRYPSLAMPPCDQRRPLAIAARCLLLFATLSSLLASGHSSSDNATADPVLVAPPAHVADVSAVRQLSWSPRAFLFPQFLSHAECDYIVNMSSPRMERSTVLSDSGAGVVDRIRTSDGTFIEKYDDPVILRIEERVAQWTFLPIECQEAMQVLRYQHTQEYGAHWDYIDEKKQEQPGGPRYATVLMYLSDVALGGETVFPQSEPDQTVKDDTWSDCGKQGIAVKARKGDALLFFSLKPDASFDKSSLHAGCPVIEGEKWSATKWIHLKSFDGPPRGDPNVCADDDDNCPLWAQMGECEKNKAYMVGSGSKPGQLGYCRKSCGVCGGDVAK